MHAPTKLPRAPVNSQVMQGAPHTRGGNRYAYHTGGPEREGPVMTPEPTDADLAGDANVWARVVAACDPHIPCAVLENLANDGDWRVRAGVANNPSTMPWLLARLANDDDARVRGTVVGNPCAPAEVLSRTPHDDAFAGMRAYVANKVANNRLGGCR